MTDADNDGSVLYEVNDGVALITIDRPHKRNALTIQMKDDLMAAVEAAGDDRAVSAVVLTGSPGSFCAGMDVTAIRAPEPGVAPEDRDPRVDGRYWFLTECPKPVVAAIDGPAVGLGAELTSHADVRFATPNAKFGWVFSKRGLIPDTGAGTWLLPRLIGVQPALRLLYSGDVIGADEALRLGYVLDVVDPDALIDTSLEFARQLSAQSPFSTQRIKQLVYEGLGLPLDEHLIRHVRAMTECQNSDDHKEGVASFLEKRAPNWTGQ